MFRLRNGDLFKLSNADNLLFSDSQTTFPVIPPVRPGGAFDYSQLKAEAVAIIMEFGLSISIQRTIEIAGDPSKPWKGTEKRSETYGAYAVKDNPKFELSIQGSELNRRTTFILDTASIEPMIGDKFTFVGKEYVITKVTDVAPGGVVILYEVEVS